MFIEKKKLKKATIILSVVILAILLTNTAVNLYLNYQAEKQIAVNVKSIENKIARLNDGDIIQLETITDFEWDTAYIYAPYTIDPSANGVFDKIGSTRGLNMAIPLSDSSNFIIFMSDKTAVCGLFGSSDYQFKYDYSKESESPKIIKKSDDVKFKVSVFENVFKEIYLLD